MSFNPVNVRIFKFSVNTSLPYRDFLKCSTSRRPLKIMVGELAARYVTVKYTDFYSTTKGIPHGVCVCVEVGGGGGLHPGVLFLDSVN